MNAGPPAWSPGTPRPAPTIRRGVSSIADWSGRFARACAPRRLAQNLHNPIFQKEVFVAGRKRSTYVIRCVSLLILLAIVVLSYLPMILEDRVNETGIEFMQRVQEIAPALTIIVIWFEYVTLMLIGPTILGGSLCDERRQGTLGALLTTPLTAFQIASGKLAAGLSQLFILVLLAMPLILALRVFGGVQVQTVLGMVGVVLTSTLLSCTLSLFFSTRAPRGFSAASAAIASMVLLHGGISIGIAAAISQGWIGVLWGQAVAVMLSGPFVLGMSSAELVGNGAPIPVSASHLCLYNSLYSLALAGVLFLALVVRLRRVMLKDAGSAVTLLTRREKRKKAGARRAGTLANAPGPPGEGVTTAPTDPSPVRVPPAFSPSMEDSDREVVLHDSREVGDRPVLWRELAQPAFKSRTMLWITLVVIVGLLLFMHSRISTPSDRHVANAMVLVVGMVISFFLATGAAAGAFAQERESRTLDVLMTTPLTAREIVHAKFWGAMRRQWFVPAVLLTHLLLTGVLVSRIPFVALIHATVAIVVPLAFVTAMGVWKSVGSKRSTAAGVKTALLALGVWVLPFPVLLFLGSIASSLGAYHLEQIPVDCATIVNPVYLGAVSLTRPNSWYPEAQPYTVPYHLFETDSVGFSTFTLLFLCVMGAYVGLTWLALRRARVLLGRQTNRLR